MTTVKWAHAMLQRTLTTALIAACCAAGATAATAASPSNPSSDIDCTQTQESMQGMKVCAGRELAKTDKALKAQRQQMLKAAAPDMRTALEKWFKAGDAYASALCAVEGQRYAGGSMQGFAVGVCLNGEYGRQLKELHERQHRPEGG